MFLDRKCPLLCVYGVIYLPSEWSIFTKRMIPMLRIFGNKFMRNVGMTNVPLILISTSKYMLLPLSWCLHLLCHYRISGNLLPDEFHLRKVVCWLGAMRMFGLVGVLCLLTRDRESHFGRNWNALQHLKYPECQYQAKGSGIKSERAIRRSVGIKCFC